jgi:predicted DNA-binding protein with PD1-like motif
MGPKETSKPTVITLDIETLNTVALRLDERADTIRQVTLVELVADIRIAARACGLLAHIRFALGEISEKTKDHDTRLEIRGLLDDAARAEPEVGQP